MQECRQLEGLIPVLVTPLNEDGSIDTDGLSRLVEYLINVKVGGFWALGTGSEDMNLTFDDRLIVAKTISETNAGRLPLIMGASFFAMNDSLRFIDATADLQFDAYHVMPYHPLLSLERNDWIYREIADYAPRPLWLYTSANWCRHFPPDFVAALKDHPNIAGVKFSSSRTTDLLKVIGMAEENFQVLTAVAAQFILCLTMGAKAGTTSLGSALPEVLIDIFDRYSSGDHSGAMAAQHALLAFMDDLPKGPKGDNFLGAAEEKFILSQRGICNPYTTSYYRDVSAEEGQTVLAAIDRAGYSISNVGQALGTG